MSGNADCAFWGQNIVVHTVLDLGQSLLLIAHTAFFRNDIAEHQDFGNIFNFLVEIVLVILV